MSVRLLVFLRKLNRRPVWLEPLEWLGDEEINVEAVQDLLNPSSENCLSLYRTEDDESRIGRVLAAIAASRDHLTKIDYAVFSETTAERVGLILNPTPAETLDEGVNNQHVDVIHLTGHKAASLARAMSAENRFCRVWPEKVKELLNTSIEAGRIDRSKINDAVKEKL